MELNGRPPVDIERSVQASERARGREWGRESGQSYNFKNCSCLQSSSLSSFSLLSKSTAATKTSSSSVLIRVAVAIVGGSGHCLIDCLPRQAPGDMPSSQLIEPNSYRRQRAYQTRDAINTFAKFAMLAEPSGFSSSRRRRLRQWKRKQSSRVLAVRVDSLNVSSNKRTRRHTGCRLMVGFVNVHRLLTLVGSLLERARGRDGHPIALLHSAPVDCSILSADVDNIWAVVHGAALEAVQLRHWACVCVAGAVEFRLG